MLDNSNNGSSDFGASQGAAVWQNEWIEELWAQLVSGQFEGVGNVIVEGKVANAETRLFSDLEAIDQMLLSSTDTSQLLAEVQSYSAERASILLSIQSRALNQRPTQ